MKKKHASTLDELLSYYDKFAAIEKKKFELFQKKARQRIIEGHKKYGEDWKEKDNIAEIEFERLDIYNYEILDKCQRSFRYD